MTTAELFALIQSDPTALTAPVVSGGLGLSPDLAAPLLALGVLPPAITAADVGAVRAEHGGKI